MIKAVLVDDEPLARSIIVEYLSSYSTIKILAECSDGFEGAKIIMQHQPDIIFLDIQMPKINGFEMLELLDYNPAVIFITAFDEHAIKAFEKHAIDYLLKPVSKSRFDQAMSKYLDRTDQKTEKKHTQQLLDDLESVPSTIERIVVKTGSKIQVIPVHAVICFAADDDYVQIHTKDGMYLKNKTMSFFEDHLDPTMFVRVHRSYIIRIECLERLEPYEKDSQIAILSNKMRVNVSKTGYAKLKQVLGL